MLLVDSLSASMQRRACSGEWSRTMLIRDAPRNPTHPDTFVIYQVRARYLCGIVSAFAKPRSRNLKHGDAAL
jgi:hypothetical protein